VLYSAPGPEARVLGGGLIARTERAPAAEALLGALLGDRAATVPA
jgi:tRNA-uridine 2-sulfurtransferase